MLPEPLVGGLTQEVPTGHQVAKLVTTVTPHRGSNTLGNLLPQPGNPNRDGLPDLASEAVRDLRYSYSCGFLLLDDCPGVYLFGGDEDDFEVFPYPFWNEDVDCDGDESSPNVIGINVDGTTTGGSEEWDGTYDNPNLPLPTNIRYTYITSDIPIDNGDGVVALSRQWLFNGGSAAPSDGTSYRLSDSLLTDQFHHICKWGCPNRDQGPGRRRLPCPCLEGRYGCRFRGFGSKAFLTGTRRIFHE